MSTGDLTVTLVGWVGTEPKQYSGAGVTPFTSFRMANTRRYFDRSQDAWTDGRTEWFTVKVWRQSALNVAASLRKGDPVLVHGRLATEQWESADGPRTALVLEALAIGPDLTYGRSTFARTVHVAGGADAAAAAGADPAATGEPGASGGRRASGDADAHPDSDSDPDPDADSGSGAGDEADDPWATDGSAVPAADDHDVAARAGAAHPATVPAAG